MFALVLMLGLGLGRGLGLRAAVLSEDASSHDAPIEEARPVEEIELSASAPGVPLPHFWETMMGSGRAILSLRDSYRQDLRAVAGITGLRYVRFHNIFHDEVGLVNLDASGAVTYNFSYVDQIYDGLLENGVRPFIEISFMPTALSSNEHGTMSFGYHPNVAPPKSYARWDELVRHFAAHLLARYGIEEVAQWYFEVWNEPNIDFWSGTPPLDTYLELYAHTARDLKAIDTRLRVGGPATAQAAWIPEFLRYTHAQSVPVDFVSSHVYADDTPQDVFGEQAPIPRDRMVCRAAQKLHDEIRRSADPGLPLFLSEFNATFRNDPHVTDAIYMGPWLADTIRQCAGLVDLMSYWSFSDVFEEQGVVKTPFYGGFGLIAERGIPKPAFSAFALLHKLGDERLTVGSNSALATRRADGTLVIALWNYEDPAGVMPQGASRPDRNFRLLIRGIRPDASVHLWRVDADHGDPAKTYDAMQRPPFPNRREIDELKRASALTQPESGSLRAGSFQVNVPAYGLAVVEITP